MKVVVGSYRTKSVTALNCSTEPVLCHPFAHYGYQQQSILSLHFPKHIHLTISTSEQTYIFVTQPTMVLKKPSIAQPTLHAKETQHTNHSYPTDKFGDIEAARIAVPRPSLAHTALPRHEPTAMIPPKKTKRVRRDPGLPPSRWRRCGRFAGRHAFGVIGLLIIIGTTIVLPMVLYSLHKIGH